MAFLPTIEELTALSLEEIQALVLVTLPPDWSFDFEEEPGERWGLWTAQITDAEGEVVFTSSYPDMRLALLNAYGFLWQRQHKPTNPVWQRRRDDLRDAARRGIMHLPGSEAVPDPDDLDPGSVYEEGSGSPTRRDR